MYQVTLRPLTLHGPVVPSSRECGEKVWVQMTEPKSPPTLALIAWLENEATVATDLAEAQPMSAMAASHRESAQMFQAAADALRSLEADKVLLDLLVTGKSPCGHWSGHAYSPDGKGKQILCLDCEVARLTRPEAVTNVIAEMEAKTSDPAHWMNASPSRGEVITWAERLKAATIDPSVARLTPQLESTTRADSTNKRWTEMLCTKCGGNGVIRITGGVCQCPRCDGRCYEPDVVEKL